MGASHSARADSFTNFAYYRPPSCTSLTAREDVIALRAAIRLQKIFRGRRARRSHARLVVASGLEAASSALSGIGSVRERTVLAAKAKAITALLAKIDETVHDTYVDSLKPRLTACPAMPQALREAVHGMGDASWQSVHGSVCALHRKPDTILA